MMGYHHWRVTERSPSGFYQDVPTGTKDSTYVFRIYVWKDNETNFDEIRLELHPYGGGPVIAAATYRAPAIRKERWNILSVEGKNPDEGIRVKVVVVPKRSGARRGAIKFDDAELVATEEKP